MNTDDLKLLAEYMGYRSEANKYRCFVISGKYKDDLTMSPTVFGEEYNPLQNNDQLVELIEKLKITIDFVSDFALAMPYGADDWTKGKNLSEAVVKAAIEAIKQ